MKKAFLFLLGLIAFIGVQAQTSPYTGSEAAAGNFFIYNVETGYWLQNNNRVNDWNSQVQVDVDGFDWELIAQDGGTWQLNPKFANNHSLNSGDANGYLDTGQPVSSWTLTPVDGVSNGYTIESNGTKFGVNPDNKLLTKDGSGAVVWQFVTAEERLAVQAAKYAEVSGNNPMDISWMIPGSNMNIADEHFDPLIRVRPTNPGNFTTGQSNNPGSGAREVWSNTNGGYDFGYKLTGLPNGVYRFTVKGFYRDGATNGIGAKHAEGTEVIRPVIYINDKTQPIMSVCQLTSNSGGCNVQTGNYFVPDRLDDACRACSAGVYDNKPIKVVITDGVIDLGIKTEEAGVGGDWLVLDKFQLVYYGPDNIESSLAMLTSAIEEAEAWDASSTTEALATQLSNAIDAAKAKLSSTDSDEVEAAAEELLAVLKAAQSINVSALKATIALAKQEGIDTSAAETIASQATSAAEVNDALFDLRAARKIKAQSMPDVYTGSEPAEGKVYIYNIGTGLFLGTGSSYNTHCAVDQVGIEVELIASGNGFKIKTNRGGGWLAKGNAEASAYVDSWNGDQVWTFIPVSAGIYNISFDGSDTNLLGYNPRSQNDNNTGIFWGSIGIKREDGADPMNQWKIVTAEERESLIANASKQNPVDVSYLITAASMNAQDNRDAWTKEVSGGNGGPWVDNFENHGFECYNADNFKLSQTIEGLKPGLYEVKVQAFWREGNGANQVAIVNNGGELQQKAYLFANDQQQPLPNIASALDIVPGIGGDATSNKGIFPNWVNEALEYIETGAYWATVKAVVGEDGKLLIGIGVDEKVADGDWVVADNFRLAYLGNDETDIAYERAVAAIKDGQTYRVFTEVNGNKFYLNTAGYLVNDTQKAATFTFTKITSGNTLYETGWNLGCKFTNPSLTNGQSGDVVQNGHIIVGTNDRNDWERQVFFLNAEGKYAVRATNANSANWGANTFWTVTDTEAELPKADYALTSNYVWQIEENVDNRPEAFNIANNWLTDIQVAAGLVTDEGQWSSNAKEPKEGSFAALTDGDYTSFFHSQWSGTGPAEDHYLQAELPDAAQEFYFYFKKRSSNNNNRPTTIVISGSNDGQNFTEITTITEGLPTDNGVLDYLSAKVAANEAYKYIRFTVPSTNNGAANNGHVFFTFSEFYILPSDELIDKARAYMDLNDYTDLTEDDVPIIKQIDADLKAAFSTVKVTYALYDGNGAEPIKTKTVVVEANSEVQVPSDFTSIAYYDYTVEGEIADVDCTIKVFRSMKNGVVHQLSDLSNDKAYTIRCDRGALLTKDDYLASTAHNSLTSAEPADFALISYEDNIYLYSVADKKFVQNNGALAEMPSNGVFDAVQMEAKTDPYFFTYFKISDSKNYGLNTNGNDPYGYVINDWMNADAGNQYYMIESSEFDATEALAALEAYFHPSYFVTYVVKDAEGTELFKSEPQPAREGDKITTLPADFQRAFTTYDEVDVTVAEAETTVEFTATSTFPFEISASFDEAKWYNMTIRSDYYVAMDETEPYYPKADKDLDAPESQWAFAGDAYNGIVVMNKAAGEGWSLTKDGDNAVMREGEYSWIIGANADGFTLKEPGTDYNCINQASGSTGPLGFWNSGNAPTDNGSTFRVTEVVEETVKTFAINVDREVGMGYTPTIATVAADDLEAAKQFLGVSELTTDMLDIVNPDGTVVFDYATYDGWFNAEGVATTWGENTAVCVKFFQALPDGAFEICDMNGADQVDKTYKVIWEFQANGKAAWFEVYVTFVAAPAPELEIVKTIEGGSIEYASSEKSYTEKSIVLTDDQVAEILAALEIESLDQATAYGWNPTTQELVANFAGYDGWRKADGDFANWSGDATAPACLKYTDGKTYLTYNINGIEAQTIKVYWAIGTAAKAVLVEFSFIYTSDAAGQDFAGAIEQTVYNRATGEALPGATETGEQTVSIAPAEDGKVNITFSGFTMPGLNMEVPEFTVTATATSNEDGSISYSAEEFTVAMQRGQMTINYTGTLEGLQANAEAVPGLHLMLSQSAIDEVYFAADADAIEALKEIFEPVPVAINGINADQLNGTIYDLGGRKIQKVQRGGVYIVNGKKVAVK